MYGEEDTGFISTVMHMADTFDGNLIRIGGAGGKQQICYAGTPIKPFNELSHYKLLEGPIKH